MDRIVLDVVNSSAEPVVLVLNPLGEVYALAPGQQRAVRYCGDPIPRLTVEYGEGEIMIWEDGPGELALVNAR